MTTGELIRSARMRAEFSQEVLAGRLGLPRSQIARWERDAVEPGFSTLQSALRACGFDISTALIPYQPDLERDERLRRRQLQSPQERLRAMIEGASEA
jgi:transcriptional regulator with XRE-family HTH domain